MKVISQSVTRSIGRSILKAKKNSPHIFFAGGIVGVVGATVLACRATLKLEETVDEIKKDVDGINELHHSAVDIDGKPYSDSDHIKDLTYVCGKSFGRLAQLYGPSVLLGTASIAALTGSHVQLTRRNAAVTATLAAVSKAYEDYRVRVQNELGKDRELELHRAISDESVEAGDSKKESIKVTDPNGWSPYARFFDEVSTEWRKNSELNRIFLQCQQNYFNHMLHARGHVFLNEVYDALGLERSQAGQVVGWIIEGDGDGYVDFGLFEATSARFINNMERSIILDFNVDGVIYDKI